MTELASNLSMGGALAVVFAFICLAVARGWLIPGRTHDRILAEANQRTADAKERGDEWKATAERVTDVNNELQRQNGELIDANKVVKAFLQAAAPSPGDTQQPRGGGL